MGIIGNRLVSDFSLEVSMYDVMQETIEMESECLKRHYES